MPILINIIIVSVIESLVSFAGGALAIFREATVRRVAHFVVSFAVGALLAVAFLDLIPEAIGMASVDAILPYVLGGVILFFILEKFLFWYHCHDGVCAAHPYTYLILWGDFLHNFVDGVIIALAFMVDAKIGFVTSIAVIAHEIPQEIGDFGLLMHGGFGRKKALWYNFLVSLATIVGAVLTYAMGAALEPLLPYAIAIIAGNFIYLAATDLMPELHEQSAPSHGLLQFAFIICGVLAVALPVFLLE